MTIKAVLAACAIGALSIAGTVSEVSAQRWNDRQMDNIVPARNAPPAQSARGRCIQQLPGAMFDRQRNRFFHQSQALIDQRCGNLR
jgi:hypothetical protein